MNTPSTLASILAQFVAADPDAMALEVVDAEGASESVLTRHQLGRRAAGAATQLAEFGVRAGDRVLISMESSAEVVCAFWGCQLLGATAVPIQPLARRHTDSMDLRLAALAQALRPSVLVVAAGSALPTGGELAIPVLALVPALEAADWPALASCEPAPALIQCTSGSTLQPRGCVLSHQSVIENARALGTTCDGQPGDAIATWVPLFHDMGLMSAVIAPVVGGGPSVLQTPRSFLLSPLSWLRVMSRFERVHGSLPNAALSLLIKRMRQRPTQLDLSGVKTLLCGAEPIDPQLVDEFLDVFAPAGLRPDVLRGSWGMAENTVLATVARGAFKADRVLRRDLEIERVARPAPPSVAKPVLRIACVGTPIPGAEVRVLDDSGQLLADRRIGNIELKSATLMDGYFADDDATRASFNGPWYRTGDLGYLVDGELYITGRLKELIIVGGRNVAPADIERLVASIGEIGYGMVAAVGIPDGDGGTEVVSVVVEHPRSGNLEALASKIRDVCFRVMQLTLRDVMFVALGTLPRTTSGKLKRLAARQDLMLGKYVRLERQEALGGGE